LGRCLCPRTSKGDVVTLAFSLGHPPLIRPERSWTNPRSLHHLLRFSGMSFPFLTSGQSSHLTRRLMSGLTDAMVRRLGAGAFGVSYGESLSSEISSSRLSRRTPPPSHNPSELFVGVPSTSLDLRCLRRFSLDRSCIPRSFPRSREGSSPATIRQLLFWASVARLIGVTFRDFSFTPESPYGFPPELFSLSDEIRTAGSRRPVKVSH